MTSDIARGDWDIYALFLREYTFLFEDLSKFYWRTK